MSDPDVEMTLFISSNPNAGAYNISEDGSSFQLNLNQILDLRGYKKIVGAVTESDVVYSWVNISSTLKNNKLYLLDGVAPITIDFSAGIYSLDVINNTIADKLGALNFNSPIYFSGNLQDGTVYAIIPAKTPAWSIDWSNVTDNIGPTLGFSNPVIDAGSTTQTSYYLSDEPARLNDAIQAAYISCSIMAGNYFGQLGGSNVVLKVSPTAQVGGLIFTRVQIPSWTPLNSNYVLNITSKLLRPDGTAMDLNGEFWSYVLMIRAWK